MVSARFSGALLLCWIVVVSADRRSVGIGFSGGSGVPSNDVHRQQRKMVQHHMTDRLTRDLPKAQPEGAATKMLFVKEPMTGDQKLKQFLAGELAAHTAGRAKPVALKSVVENAEVVQPELGEQEKKRPTQEPSPGPIGGGGLLSVEDAKAVLQDGGEVNPKCNSTKAEQPQAARNDGLTTVAPEHKGKKANKVKVQVKIDQHAGDKAFDLPVGKSGAAGARRRKLQSPKGEFVAHTAGRKNAVKDHGNLNDLVAKLL